MKDAVIRTKVCGLRRPEDISYVNELRPDYIGFVFAEGRRTVNTAQAEALRGQLHSGIKAVGVFVNAPVSQIISLLRSGIIDLAQLHGDEPESDIQAIHDATGKQIIRTVIPTRDTVTAKSDTADAYTASMHKVTAAFAETEADFLLFDSGKGSGRTLDIRLLTELVEDFRIQKPFFLAGGLTPENTAERIAELERIPVLNRYLYGVDVSSGVETDGYKDREKMSKFLLNSRLPESGGNVR